MVVRPGFGTMGRKVKAFCNLFELSWETDIAFQYDVTIEPVQGGGGRGGRGRGRVRGRGRGRESFATVTPTRIRTELCRTIFAAAVRAGMRLPFGSSYDGRNILFVPGGPIADLSPKRVKVMVDDKEKSYLVSLKPTSKIYLNQIKQYLQDLSLDIPRPAVGALDVTLRHIASMDPRNSTIGCGIFTKDRLAQMISPGVHAWAGYTQSVYPCQNGVYLNINSCFKPFVHEQTVAEFMVEAVSSMINRRVTADQLHTVMNADLYKQVEIRLGKLSTELKKLKVKTIHNPRRETYPNLAGFARGTSQSTTFQDRSGITINVVEYLKKDCGYIVKYPHLRLLATLKKDKPSRIELPPECVLIKRQNYKKDLGVVQKARLIQAATLNPKDKKQYIERTLSNQLSNQTNNNHLRAWGIHVKRNMLEIPVRVLPAPHMACGEDKVVDVQGKGEWDIKENQFANPVNIKSWGLVNFCKDEVQNPDIEKFFDNLMAVMKKKGMTVNVLPFQIDAKLNEIPYTTQILQKCAEGAKAKYNTECQILMIILPDVRSGNLTTDELYQEVKIASDQLIGIPSQCILSTKSGLSPSNGARNRNAYLYNLTLKMNAKMGGSHSVLYTPPDRPRSFTYPLVGDKPFMVMGADLTHPPPASDDQRSVAGVVGSLDQDLAQYACRGLVQEVGVEGREVIVDLKSAVKDLLLAFYRRNNGLRPESILFYRDGVSQGEFPKVVTHEFKAIKQACAEMGDPGANYHPKITFITVQKRHNIRILPANLTDVDASGNSLPGTVVDTNICNPHGFDFYLISHAGIQGTSRPALYSVLVDENNFDADSLQTLTYWMCHVFCRCTRSVSYCPPAYYAHHAATRCKILHLNSRKGQKPVHEKIKDKLYFV
eukprot:g6107.t1